jgi:L-lactate dehydrogenase complex protein LldG
VTETRETGDRAAFLDRIRSRQGPPPTIGPHPPPPAPDVVPEVRFKSLDGVDDLRPVFVAAATRPSAVVHEGVDIATVLADLVATHGVTSAVVTAEPEAVAAGELLAGLGVEVAPYSRDAAAAADLGITSAIAGVAATGSLVLDAAVAGSRGTGLLPPVHLCVLPVDRLVATPSDVLRRGPRPLPSNRVLVTGPSRTGDIEQIITLGAHGPTALHIALT